MRKLASMILAVAVIGCGSDGNGGGTTPVAGLVGGQAFTPTSVKAATATPTSCPNLPQPLGASGVSAIGVSFDTTGAFCTDLGNLQCPRHPSKQTVTIFIANIVQGGTTAPAIGTGTYTVDPLSVATVLQGKPLVVTANALATDAACAGSPRTGATGGTVRIDSITSTQIKGHVDVSFGCGGATSCATPDSLKGDFTADLCSGVDICAAATAQTACSVSGTPNVCLP